jgi:hypothetical protein
LWTRLARTFMPSTMAYRSGPLPWMTLPFNNGDVNARQRQLAGQHQPCRTSSDDHHRMVGHRHTPVVSAAAINSAPRDQHVDGPSEP